MDSILSSVLSIFSHNPIFVLGIIAYIAFSIIKSKNTDIFHLMPAEGEY